MRVLAALVLLTIMTLAVPAVAKGPEKGTLTGPGIERPIEFLDQSRPHETYDVEPPYDLIGLTGLFSPRRLGLIAPPSSFGEGYTVTWTMFGTAGIVQHIYPDAEGGPLIHNPEQAGLVGWGSAGWLRAPEGIEAAIDEVVEWGQGSIGGASPPWILPAIAALIVAALSLWGSAYGAQASTNSANASTVGAAGMARITDSSMTASSN